MMKKSIYVKPNSLCVVLNVMESILESSGDIPETQELNSGLHNPKGNRVIDDVYNAPVSIPSKWA